MTQDEVRELLIKRVESEKQTYIASDASTIGVTVAPTDTEPSAVNVENEALSNIQQMLQGAVDNGMLVRVADTPLLALNTDIASLKTLLTNHIPPMAMNVNQTIPNLIRERNPVVINNHYDCLVNVEGNVDKNVAKLLPQQLEQAYKYVTDKQYHELMRLK